MADYYQFGPIKELSGAKGNAKCKAITQFIKDHFERRSFNGEQTNRDAIMKRISEECAALDSNAKGGKGSLKAYSLNTFECGCIEDWKLSVYYKTDTGNPTVVCEMLCFRSMGAVSE